MPKKRKMLTAKWAFSGDNLTTPFLARLSKGHTNSSTLGKLFNLFILSLWLINVDNKIFTWLLIVPSSRRNNRCWECFWKMRCYRNLRNPIVILILVTLMIKQLRWRCWEIFASVMRSGITVCAVNCVFQFLLCSSGHISPQINVLHGCVFILTYLFCSTNTTEYLKIYWIPANIYWILNAPGIIIDTGNIALRKEYVPALMQLIL